MTTSTDTTTYTLTNAKVIGVSKLGNLIWRLNVTSDTGAESVFKTQANAGAGLYVENFLHSGERFTILFNHAGNVRCMYAV